MIGAGHNGLTAALTLARAGREVLVVERSAVAGGVCAPREFAPGYRVPGLLPDTTGFRPRLVEDLGLARHGLTFRDREPAVLVPLAGEGRLLTAGSETIEWSGVSPEDVAAHRDWRRFLDRIAPFIRRLLDSPPPRLDVARGLFSGGEAGLGGLAALAGSGWALRRLGRATTTELLRVLPMCVADWLNERFPTEALAAALAAPALVGSYNGPWAAGTAAGLVFRECTRGRSAVGGPAALVGALAAACEAAGVSVLTDRRVEAITVRDGRVGGVRLAGGEEIATGTIVATCNPRTTLLELVGARWLDATTELEIERFRCRGTTAVMLLAVDGPVEVAALPGEPVERLRLGASSFDELERAFDAVKYRQASPQPYSEVWIPSIESPELAPAGCHVVAALVSCAPYDLADGWSPTTREVLIQGTVRQINDHIPGIRERLAGGKLLAPPDLERELALPGGHLFHGESALDQFLFLRPGLGLAHYATPIEGLYLGGGGSHPGGGISGMPGRLGAQAALAR